MRSRLFYVIFRVPPACGKEGVPGARMNANLLDG